MQDLIGTPKQIAYAQDLIAKHEARVAEHKSTIEAAKTPTGDNTQDAIARMHGGLSKEWLAKYDTTPSQEIEALMPMLDDPRAPATARAAFEEIKSKLPEIEKQAAFWIRWHQRTQDEFRNAVIGHARGQRVHMLSSFL